MGSESLTLTPGLASRACAVRAFASVRRTRRRVGVEDRVLERDDPTFARIRELEPDGVVPLRKPIPPERDEAALVLIAGKLRRLEELSVDVHLDLRHVVLAIVGARVRVDREAYALEV